MAMTKIPDIAFEIDGEFINLEQDIGCGEVHSVQLHRLHLQHIAGQLGFPIPDASASHVLQRFQAVIDKLDGFACSEYYRSDILDRCSMGLEILTVLDAILDLGHEFLADLSPKQDGDKSQAPSTITTPGQKSLV